MAPRQCVHEPIPQSYRTAVCDISGGAEIFPEADGLEREPDLEEWQDL